MNRLLLRNTFNLLLLLTAAMLLQACALTRFSDANASGYRSLEREECVPYARRVSGINLRGDAYTWWESASGVYARGRAPAPGAVLVLAKTSKLRRGHLAVVADVLGPHDINVTHANWGNDWLSRRVIYEAQRVQDVSSNKDWSLVRFWNRETGKYGFPYPAMGFIYNQKNYASADRMPAAQTMAYQQPAPAAAPRLSRKNDLGLGRVF